MAAQVEVQPGEVGRTVVGPRLHLSPLADSSNSLMEIPSPMSPTHILAPESDKPAPGPKPRLTPKPFSAERNTTIKPILAPKPHPRPRPESIRLSGYKPEPSSPRAQDPGPVWGPSPLSRATAASFKTFNKLASGQTTKPVVHPFKPAPPLDPEDPGIPSPSERQKPLGSSLAYSRSFKKPPSAEWSGSTTKDDEKDQVTSGRAGPSITRAKSMGFLVQVGQEDQEKDIPKPEETVALRSPRESKPRPVSAIYLDSPALTDAPFPDPRFGKRRPLSADLTSKFESIGLSLHRRTPKMSSKELLAPEEGGSTPPSIETVAKPAVPDRTTRGSIKARISLLQDSSSPGPDPQSPVLSPEAEPPVGVKQLIRQLTEDTTPTHRPSLKPRPQPLDLSKRFYSERSPDLGSEATDRHDIISKDPPRRIESSPSFSPSDQRVFVDLKDPQEKKASRDEVQTVRASVFENVVERRSVLMVDDVKPASPKTKTSLRSPSFKSSEDEGTVVTATFREPASPSSPLRVLHAFDMVQAVEETRAVSENVQPAQREDKATTLRRPRSERRRTTPAEKTPDLFPMAAEQQPSPRYLRVGALQKWTTKGLEQEDKGTTKDSMTKRPKTMEEQPKPKATYFALTGQMQEPPPSPSRDKDISVKTSPLKRNPSLDNSSGKSSQDEAEDEAMKRREQKKLKALEREKLRQLEVERAALSGFQKRKEREEEEQWQQQEEEERRKREEERQQQEEERRKREEERLDRERQLLDIQKERQRLEELRRSKEQETQQLQELQLQRLKEEKEKEEREEAERMRQVALDQEVIRMRELEKEREQQKKEEMERKRKEEQERVRKEEMERKRKEEMVRKRKEEQERVRKEEMERKRKEEMERKRKEEIELERQKLQEEAEKMRQAAMEQELLRMRELEKEKERQKKEEQERVRREEMERRRREEMERKRREEQERVRREEMERKRKEEMERKRKEEIELERQKLQEEAEKMRQAAMEQELLRMRELEKEKERQKKEEQERVRREEMERRRREEMERKRREEQERVRREEMERKRKEEQERVRKEEQERVRKEEMERKRREEMEREEAEKMRQAAMEQEILRMRELEKERERQKKEEQERVRREEMERKMKEEMERRRREEMERKRREEQERVRREEMERKRKEEQERVRREEMERKRREEQERVRREEMEREEAEKMRQVALEQEILRMRELEKERERQKKEEQERVRREEMERKMKEEMERKRREEQERVRREEQERVRREEMERKMKEEMERRRIEELERKRREEQERVRREEMERKMKEEMERKRREEQERVRREELEKQRLRQALEKEEQRREEQERVRREEQERVRREELERQKLREEAEKLRQAALEQEILRMRELEKQRQQQLDLEQQELEKQRQRREELERRRLREEAEKLRQAAKQQEAERQRLRRKEEQEVAPLRPRVVDLDSVIRTDPVLKASPQHGDPATRWKEPSPRPSILDLDPLTAPPAPSRDLFPDAAFGAKAPPAGEREISWRVPTTSPTWTLSPQDPWELNPVEMSVDTPISEPRKTSTRPSVEQILLRQEERVLSPQVSWSSLLDEPLIPLGPSPMAQTRPGGAAESISTTATEPVWFLRDPQEPKAEDRSHRRSEGSQELNRIRSRSVSRRSAPSGSAVEASLNRMRSRSTHREHERHSVVSQKLSAADDEDKWKDSGETPGRETDSQYGTWETGLRTDDSLTPVSPSSLDFSPSPRKPSPPQTLRSSSLLDGDAVDSFLSQAPSFPDAPTVLLDNSALRSRAQLGKRRAPRTRPTRAARHSAAPVGGASEDWIYRDSTELKPQTKDEDSGDEDSSRVDSGSAAAQRIALFPGIDPSALKAHLKKRGDSDLQLDGSAPSHVSRPPKSPFLPRAARVLPPAGGRENGEEASPQWLKELKSKKRLSQYDNES